MNKYTAILIGSIATIFSFTSHAAYSDRYARVVMCNPYKNNCHRVYQPERSAYYSYEKRYQWRKNSAKRPTTKNTEPKHVYVAPPEKIEDSNIINVNLNHGTWGAYDTTGNLVNSGRVSGGKSYCPDIKKNCKTATGTFTVYDKRGANCKSKIFPVGKGGAPMPYCMFFYKGFAIHGSNAVPNYNASHGCVRMSPSDAKWLSQNFVNVGTTRVNVTYDKNVAEDKKVLSQTETE